MHSLYLRYLRELADGSRHTIAIKQNLCHLSLHSACHCIGILISTLAGKWKMLKCGNQSTETEVRKPKYGSEKKSRLSVFSAFLTNKCACWGLVDKRGLNLCDVRAGSSALGLRQASLTQIVQCSACESQTQTKANSECLGQPCGFYIILKVMQMRVLS